MLRGLFKRILTRSIQRDALRFAGRRNFPLAFVFDIDGVLIRGEDVLPPAKRALSMLEGDNPFNMKLPYILLTNGGGISEQERCAKLSTKLGFKIDTRQYIQAHTILNLTAPKYIDTPVLVLGGKLDQVRKVAANYGFNRAYTSHDVLAWNPSVWPFHQLTDTERAATKPANFSQTPISAIFVFHDPRNWALDVQVICDVIQSAGLIGGPYVPLERQTNPVELVFLLGQGAFKAAFHLSVPQALTGSEYPYIQFGKPAHATYDFAAHVLRTHMQDLLGRELDGPLPPIYMVGDNPESDIAGANGAGWESVLVKTGVFTGAQPTHQPTYHAEDVEEADKRIDSRSESTASDTSSITSASRRPIPSTIQDNANHQTLSLESLSEDLANLAALTTRDNSRPAILVDSHLSAVYDKDAFDTLFTDVFATSENPASLDDFISAFPALDELPLRSGTQEPWFQELLMHPHNSLPPAERTQNISAMYLFFTAWTPHMPVVHTPTFTMEDNPPYLLKAMKACGAVFVRTRKASTYITDSLAAAREGLSQGILMDPTEQVHLVIAVVLLQAVGLWHQQQGERALSRLYHTMLVTMIRSAGLISKNTTWSPSKTDNVQKMWREWAFHEMTKRQFFIPLFDPQTNFHARALLLSYLHDCCQPIYFGFLPSYQADEVTFNMPCEEALWKAGSAEEWFSILQTPSVHYSSQCRLAGLDMRTSLASMNDPQFIPSPNLSRFCHFILIHTILRDLFIACSEPIQPASESSAGQVPSEAILSAQYALHNWLHSWTTCAAREPLMGDPSFFKDVLPFYWLGQVTILAYQEGLPPFNSPRSDTGEVRFKMVKRWLRHIRAFLNEGDESTIFWDELMKIQLQNWQLEYETDGGVDDQDGILGFFPDV
ncbi:Fungal-trans domain-containing protein [Mycena sanguinolenta]|uniref:Fungal-trans domain-containing protein n=1 Tax=Mycena sanguinolenta TaxID=230812 RepID=A0A8H6ZI18_9AGAR|nr:Fungal-trans domain-containing protein [Mycena sanguinolenta]